MPKNVHSGPDARRDARTSAASQAVHTSRGLSEGKTEGGGAPRNHATLSVWAATLILCGILVFGAYQIRDRLEGIQKDLERVAQDNKLLLEGLDEILAREDQAAREAETESLSAEPLDRIKRDKVEKNEQDKLARRYKIYYRAKEGEDLTRIAEKFRVSEDQLRLWNSLEATDSLIPGQVLVINKSMRPEEPTDAATESPPSDTGGFVAKTEPAPATAEPATQKGRLEPQAQTEEARNQTTAEKEAVDGAKLFQGVGESVTPESEEWAAEEGEPLGTGSVAGTPSEPIEEIIHVVQAGETLSEIGQEYGISLSTLEKDNGIANPDSIYEGQKLKIRSGPMKGTADAMDGSIAHTVQAGENLYRIGLKYGIGWEEIARKNNIVDSSRLFAGQVLTIPVARGGPEVSSTEP